MHQMESGQAGPAPAWIGRQDGGQRLVASRHRATGRCVFPRLPEHSPAAPRYEPVTLSRHARLYSFTVIHPNPKTCQKPFTLVYADFPEGARVFGRLRLPEGTRPVIGSQLEVVVEPSADGEGSYAFAPAWEELQ
jgi:uncharacterized protein